MGKFNNNLVKNLLKYEKKQSEIVGTFDLNKYYDISDYFNNNLEVERLLELIDKTLLEINNNNAKRIALFIDISEMKDFDESQINIDGLEELPFPEEIKNMLKNKILEHINNDIKKENIRCVEIEKNDLTDLFKFLVEILLINEEFELLNSVKKLTNKYPEYFNTEKIFKW